ncbi:glycoside hydrolase family 38 C-terminal domain-containing protein [Microbacterium terrae]|uniref:Mannosylglycerate hydrolase n=1 Tax=Microbacterium terrae TaxID=69369 RepID=A0A0M2H4I1_9MICO|nr:glycoside hydrolase family 38 C-terminal domain-containing protein [Microbacterium terrae]KJL38642.1 Mannosylglycerate hydrolase [Microbacterium terrae]GLJ96881.1 putative glycosyl hydrolase [Microbacterium terrae]
MHDNREVTEGRIERFVRDILFPALYIEQIPLAVRVWDDLDEPVPFAHAAAQAYRPVELPYAWGRAWSTSWFRAEGRVPERWLRGDDAATRVELIVDLGFTHDRPGFQVEGLVFRPDGTTVKSVNPRSSHVPVAQTGDGIVDLLIEGAANPNIAGDWTWKPTPLGDKRTAGDELLYDFRRCDVALMDVTVWELLQDVWTLDGLMRELPVESPRRHRILGALERLVDVVDPADVSGTAAQGRDALVPALSAPASASSHAVVAIGHAHIDSAWLWPIRETIRKCARTFSSVLALMDADPEFRFACSSAQQLKWMKDDYPEIFDRIVEKVRSGQFIPVGGMWVEPDMNLPGAEAMVRQFVTGKRFFLEEFGVDTREAWVPDTFGYSGALPQIIRASGTDWFLTQKISWNQTNTMPHHTFLWEGIDGTRVFTHFPPADTYVSEVSGAELARAERTFHDHRDGSVSLLPFGFGDGGGGPTREMMAAVRRTRSLEGSPTVEIDTPARFFERAEAEMAQPPVWSGELYLELHRASYTTQHRTKQGNRRNEHWLREAELWAATAAVRTGADYPYDALERIWQLVLLQQFHDILPGTSIAWVHREVEENNVALAAELDGLIAEALARFDSGDGEAYLANAAPFTRDGVAALGAARRATSAAAPTLDRTVDGHVLDNGLVRVVIDDRGLIVSLVDLTTGRDAIAPGAEGNLLQLHRDLPNKWDAWDVDDHYLRVSTDIASISSIAGAEHPGAVSVTVARMFGASSIAQTLTLRAGDPALHIDNDVDWHEKSKLLKLAFPLDVHADRVAAETQFGHVQRPTHSNTSWDAARFELCAHRWFHVAEPGFGVAIANESSHGYDAQRTTRADGGTTTTARVSLLRGPTFPDPRGDEGRHRIGLSIRVGADVRAAIREGYRLNLGDRRAPGPIAPLVRVDHPAVLVESVKLAEDRGGDVVVRLYESEGARATTRVAFDFDVAEVVATDLIEREIDPPAGFVREGEAVSLRLRPFQLVTLRVRRA